MSHVRVTDSPTSPPAGWMSVTLVGTGASTAVPVIGHMDRDCACTDALAREHSRNKRNNVSLLITLPYAAAATATTTSSSEGEACSIAPAPVVAQNCPCNNVALSATATATAATATATATTATATATTTTTTSSTPTDTTRRLPSHADFSAAAITNASSSSSSSSSRAPVKHVLIDCGKTFRDAYFGVLLRHGVCRVDALLLTHGHADAMGGLDDLRDVQPMHMLRNGHWFVDAHIPTYLSAATLQTMQTQVGYVVRNSQLLGKAPRDAVEHAQLLAEYDKALQNQQEQQEQQEQQRQEAGEAVTQSNNNSNNNLTTTSAALVGQDIGVRRSTALQLFVLPDDTPTRFYIDALRDVTTTTAASEQSAHSDGQGFAMYALPVEHGKGYMCLGFVFGRGVALRSSNSSNSSSSGSCVVYLSDVSALPPAAEAFLRDLVKIDVLIVDCLHRPGKHSVIHYCMDDVVQLVVQLRPRHVYCVGMFCDIVHDRGCAELHAALQSCVAAGQLRADDVQTAALAYDGMQLLLPQ